MKRRSFLQQMLRAGVAAMAAPLILREVIQAEFPSCKGIYEQLLECRTDHVTGTLNLPELFNALYALKRERQREGYSTGVYLDGTEFP